MTQRSAVLRRRKTHMMNRPLSTAVVWALAAVLTTGLAGCQSASAELVSAAASATPGTTPAPAATPTPVTTTRDEVVVEAVPFGRSAVDDAGVPSGESHVATPGRDGERTLTYRVTLVDGVETARELTSDVVTLEPTTEVTVNGTYVAPPPPAAPVVEPAPQAPAGGGCDANYADACVPMASDVDCEGGSGNGPAYVRGPVRVVGSDVYGLDSDSDGFGCES